MGGTGTGCVPYRVISCRKVQVIITPSIDKGDVLKHGENSELIVMTSLAEGRRLVKTNFIGAGVYERDYEAVGIAGSNSYHLVPLHPNGGYDRDLSGKERVEALERLATAGIKS